MRILLTVPSLAREFGGPVTKVAGLRRSMTEQGVSVAVVGCGSSEDEGVVGLPVLTKFHSTPVPRKIRPISRAVEHVDVVHVLGYRDPVGTLAAFAAHRRGIPYVVEPVGMYGPKMRSHRLKSLYQRIVGTQLIARAQRVIATSNLEAGDMRSEGVPPQQIALRPNGVAVDDLIPLPDGDTFRRRYAVPSGAPLILVLSRISMTKGLHQVVDALPRIEDAWLVIAGPDEKDGTRAALQRRLAEEAASRCRIITGGVWGSEKAEALAAADCLCLPSTTESFGLAAAEAVAVGRPVVVSDRCGGLEWLRDAAVASFQYGDIEGLTSALRTMLTDAGWRRRAEASAPRLRDRLGWPHVAELQLTIYKEALASAR